VNLSFLTPDSLVVYVGGNVDGGDGKAILDLYNSSIVIIEPVPDYFKQLETRWAGYRRTMGFRAELYNVGLGAVARQVQLDSKALAGEGTFGMAPHGELPAGERWSKTKVGEAKGATVLRILEAGAVLRNLLLSRQILGVEPTIDLLHINCEGCEWEALESMLESGGLLEQV
jgi:hypothetical protein